MEHDFCRILYFTTCRDQKVSARRFTAYTYSCFDNDHQVYDGKKVVGEYSGCCKWAAKTAYLDEQERQRERGELS